MATQNQILEQQATEIETDLQQFETQYEISSAEFYQRFRAGELGDDIDFVEWSSCYQMLYSVGECL